MQIAEEANQVDLRLPRITADKPLKVGLPEPLPNLTFHWGVFGPPRSGKSSQVAGLITGPYRGVFGNVIWCAPQTSMDSFAKSPLRDLEFVYNEFHGAVLDEIIDIAEENAAGGRPTLLVIDDFAASLRDANLQKAYAKMVQNRRHIRLSIIVIAQGYMSVPLNVRKLFSNITMFRPNNSRELTALHSELIPMSKVDFMGVYHYIFGNERPHTFMFMDVDGGILYREWNRLRIKN